MINEKEIEAVNLSATKKDFYQIWNELLDTASKLSERWDPTSTNESDPGIVLLKVLTAIADKLNYTIDKNTLEAFMPSAAQEESMRKLCEMLGYNMKYYQSAVTDVTVSYNGEKAISSCSALSSTGVILPIFTNIKNTDNDINYFTLETVNFDDTVNKTRSIACMEGETVLCGDDVDNIITISQIDDNYRYYLPENQIAENGIFIYNINDSNQSDFWEKVDNLNTQQVGKLCYKFGFDSKKQRPYVQFPDDISTIIEDGLVIRYTRTNGANGNISYNTLTTLEAPALWSDDTYKDASDILKVSNFAVKNPSATINGCNKETLNDAYNNYKKTIGTFDTLVTCRDYMNKIYQLTSSSSDQTPLVSNIIVSDIRDDINKAITLCTFNEYGIAYSDKSITTTETKTYPKAEGEGSVAVKIDMPKISNFDLVLYPFTAISGNVDKTSYQNSFKYTTVNKSEIEEGLKENKTISHNLVYPEANDIVCIKNYLRLVCQITTKAKVNSNEEAVIKKNIYKQLYTDFNARKVDFGEKLITESIEESIKNADTRIKNISLNEPTLITKFCRADGTEDLAENVYKQTYNWLALRNVLAGRIPLFEYDTDFKPEYSEAKYSGYESVYKKGTNYIKSITSDFKISPDSEKSISGGVTLNENEVVQFRAPNFKTTLTYPAYVNYFLHLKETNSSSKATPATFGSLRDYMVGNNPFSGKQAENKWEDFVNQTKDNKLIITMESKAYNYESAKPSQIITDLTNDETYYGCLFEATKSGEVITGYTKYEIPTSLTSNITLYYFKITDITYGSLYNYICSKEANYIETGSTSNAKLLGMFRSLGADQSRSIGKMVDDKKVKYAYCYTQLVSTQPLDNYYIQITFDSDDETTYQHTKDGLGRDADLTDKTIKANTDYQLKETEWLAINYTPSTTNEDGTTSTGDAVNIVYTGPIDDKKPNGDIIRPNFDMVDSTTYKANHSPSKTSGYNFTEPYQGKINDGNKPGMFAFDTKEQVEIRKPVEVVLDSIGTNIYWERNDEDQLATTEGGDTLVFKYDEDPKTAGGTDYTAYTLKEGEYIYYTDESKIDLAYYGNGTKIIKKTNTPALTKRKTDAEKLADKIVNEGLLAALPWTTYDFSGTSKSLTLKEYQYITLTEGDKLVSVGSDDSKIAQAIDKIWKTVTDNKATYQLQDSSTTTSLPGIVITEHEWQVRSILNINMGPTMYQTLHNTKWTDGTTTNTITLNWSDNTTTPFTPQLKTGSTTEYVPLCIESNYLCQSSTGSADTQIIGYDADGNKTGYINDFAVKLFKSEAVKQKDSESKETNANLNNYGTGNWTKISFKDCAEMTLNANILTGTHGLIMFYYNDTVTEPTQKAYLTISTGTINICNASNNSTLFENGWWKNHTGTSTPKEYYLNNGLNIVEVPQECQITIHTGTNADNSTLVFSDLDLVKYETNNFKINPAIDYQTYTGGETTAIAQILKDIVANDKDYKFYYNAAIDNSTAIDLNTTIGEKLSDADTWYDYNNINNKFVISEIDADYLSTGITLTSSSKR